MTCDASIRQPRLLLFKKLARRRIPVLTAARCSHRMAGYLDIEPDYSRQVVSALDAKRASSQSPQLASSVFLASLANLKAS